MRGLDRLQQIRRDGFRPQGVVLFDAAPGRVDCDADVSAAPSDRPGLTDLRVFRGLSVIVAAKEIGQADPWARAISNAGADTVAVCVTGRFEGPVFLKFKGEVLA